MLTALQPVTPKDPLLRLGRYLAQKSTGPVEKKIAELVGQAREEFPHFAGRDAGVRLAPTLRTGMKR